MKDFHWYPHNTPLKTVDRLLCDVSRAACRCGEKRMLLLNFYNPEQVRKNCISYKFIIVGVDASQEMNILTPRQIQANYQYGYRSQDVKKNSVTSDLLLL